VLTTIIFTKNTARTWELRFRSLHLPTQLLLNFGNYYGTYEGTRALQEQGHSEELEMGVLKRGRGVREANWNCSACPKYVYRHTFFALRNFPS